VVRPIKRRKVVMMSAGTAGGITMTGFSGLASANHCDYGESEAPFEKIKDAAETAVCETNDAVEELEGRIEDLNDHGDCAWNQESDSPYHVRAKPDCEVDVPFDGEGCGDTDYNKFQYNGVVTKYLWLSDKDSQEMADVLEAGFPIALGFAAGAIAVAGLAGGIVGLAAAAAGVGAGEVGDEIRNENEGCGVRIRVIHPEFDRAEPLEDAVDSKDDYSLQIKTQSEE
jgi:hypothetical protein